MATPMAALSITIGLGTTLLSSVDVLRNDAHEDDLATLGVISHEANMEAKAEKSVLQKIGDKSAELAGGIIKGAEPAAFVGEIKTTVETPSGTPNNVPKAPQANPTPEPPSTELLKNPKGEKIPNDVTPPAIPGKSLSFTAKPAVVSNGGGRRSTRSADEGGSARPVGTLMRALKRRYIGSKANRKAT